MNQAIGAPPVTGGRAFGPPKLSFLPRPALTGPDGTTVPAAELARATATTLHAMRFAKVVTTEALLRAAKA
ncbi:hypothetical protein ACIRYZ_17165 [Kitasatospora sp. NPDC101155]|uniref:hypothetical protein n=1 Tax=Kitasatospora sp. NPDC101155 TaxID=3364097 RepID=UPI00382B407C